MSINDISLLRATQKPYIDLHETNSDCVSLKLDQHLDSQFNDLLLIIVVL